MARQRRLCSSITLRNLSRRPSAVASNWKSNCFAEAQGLRTDLVRVLSLLTSHRAVCRACPLLLAGVGRCRPSSRQSRCTRLWFTVQPSRRSRRWAMRRPQRMCSAAISRRRCLSLASSKSTTLPTWRWLLRCWPTTRQTLRWDAR